MFTQYGLDCLLTALAQGAGKYGAVFIIGGSKSRIFTADAGYPKRNDLDEANDGRGASVLTWKFTIPKGVPFSAPATDVELVDSTGGALYKTRFPAPVHADPNRASIVYLNIYLGAR